MPHSSHCITLQSTAPFKIPAARCPRRFAPHRVALLDIPSQRNRNYNVVVCNGLVKEFIPYSTESSRDRYRKLFRLSTFVILL
jgi:hypothetical protein